MRQQAVTCPGEQHILALASIKDEKILGGPESMLVCRLERSEGYTMGLERDKSSANYRG